MFDILILGAGWTSTFLITALEAAKLSFAATTRSGSDHNNHKTIPFTFDPTDSEENLKLQFSRLPDASVILISFPIERPGASALLVNMYISTRSPDSSVQSTPGPGFIQLGSTGIWGPSPRTLDGQIKVKGEHLWYDRKSPYTLTERAKAEDELLALDENENTRTTVLNLAGLYGGSRQARHWVPRIAPTKEVVRNKGSLHLIHGEDIARVIIAIIQDFSKVSGQRWILTNCRVYDWWDLISAWCPEPESSSLSSPSQSSPNKSDSSDGIDRAKWVRDLMREEGVAALPRPPNLLGRALDSRDIWEVLEMSPSITTAS